MGFAVLDPSYTRFLGGDDSTYLVPEGQARRVVNVAPLVIASELIWALSL